MRLPVKRRAEFIFEIHGSPYGTLSNDDIMLHLCIFWGVCLPANGLEESGEKILILHGVESYGVESCSPLNPVLIKRGPPLCLLSPTVNSCAETQMSGSEPPIGINGASAYMQIVGILILMIAPFRSPERLGSPGQPAASRDDGAGNSLRKYAGIYVSASPSPSPQPLCDRSFASSRASPATAACRKCPSGRLAAKSPGRRCCSDA